MSDLEAGLAEFIAGRAEAPVSILALGKLPGGTMRRAWTVDVEVAAGPFAGRHRLIYLIERRGTLFRSRLGCDDELRVLRVMHAAGVRVPRPYWSVGDSDPTGLEPGLILERVDGETVARRILQDPAFGAVRPRLLTQMGEELARIHAAPTDGLGGLGRPPDGIPPARAQLDEMERTLDEMGMPRPALELALRWLRRSIPERGRLVVVHGDFRLGNFIVDPAEGLRAVLDWELAHLGDPGEDLGWIVMRFWRCVDRPGFRGLGPAERVADAYAAVSGRRLDPERARYWEIFANLRWAVVTLRQSWRHLAGGERCIELASIARHCAEVEWELLRLMGGH